MMEMADKQVVGEDFVDEVVAYESNVLVEREGLDVFECSLDACGEWISENDIVTPGAKKANEGSNGVGGEDEHEIDVAIPIPSVGMVFSSWEDVDNYFRSYGKQNGFGVLRGGGSYKQKKGPKTIRSYTWRCECAGQVDSRRMLNGKRVLGGVNGFEVRRRKTKKCGCPVMIYAAVRYPEGDWVVKRAIVDHLNHNPTPRKTRYIPQFHHDEITIDVRRKLFNDVYSGAKIRNVHRSLARERGGIENMAISERDLRNIIAKEKRLKMNGGDANAMFAYFKKMTSDNQNFFHMSRVDEFNALSDIMWVDARSRVAFEEFGDVVCFDSTYITNDYELPFSNFVGVNHHGQSTLLGCALLSHENTETFIWLFETWLSCMGGKHPDGFLTDQCQAMRKALTITMPGVKHRWCLWHIMQKFSQKLGKYKNFLEFSLILENIIYDSFNEQEFKMNWIATIEAYELEDDEWLKGLFDERKMWIPAFLNDTFWAGMKTTQRSESINSFFDGYVHKHTRLYEFAENYCHAMESRVKDENEADASSAMRLRHLVSDFTVETFFRDIYTDAKFAEIQDQCMKTLYVGLVRQVQVSEDVIEHVLVDRVWKHVKETKKYVVTKIRRQYTVSFNTKTHEASCICKWFETHGIMCRHLIKVFDTENVCKVPEMFILRRWRKDVVRRHKMVKVAYHDPTKTEEVQRRDKLMVKFDPISYKAATEPECVEVVIEALKDLDIRVQRLLNEIQQRKDVEMDVHLLFAEGDNITNKSNMSNESPPSVNKIREDTLTPKSSIQLTLPQEATPGQHSLILGPISTTQIGSNSKIVVESIKDPAVKKRKPGRPRGKRYLSCTEKSNQKSKNVVIEIPNEKDIVGPKESKVVGKKRKCKEKCTPSLPNPIFQLNQAFQSGPTAPVMHGSQHHSIGGIGIAHFNGGVGYFTQAGQPPIYPGWLARDVLGSQQQCGQISMDVAADQLPTNPTWLAGDVLGYTGSKILSTPSQLGSATMQRSVNNSTT